MVVEDLVTGIGEARTKLGHRNPESIRLLPGVRNPGRAGNAGDDVPLLSQPHVSMTEQGVGLVGGHVHDYCLQPALERCARWVVLLEVGNHGAPDFLGLITPVGGLLMPTACIPADQRVARREKSFPGIREPRFNHCTLPARPQIRLNRANGLGVDFGVERAWRSVLRRAPFDASHRSSPTRSFHPAANERLDIDGFSALDLVPRRAAPRNRVMCCWIVFLRSGKSRHAAARLRFLKPTEVRQRLKTLLG